MSFNESNLRTLVQGSDYAAGILTFWLRF